LLAAVAAADPAPEVRVAALKALEEIRRRLGK
jgi:hypothetical protein